MIISSSILSIEVFEMNKGLYVCMRACHYEGLVSISVLDVSHTAVEKNLECRGCGVMLYLEILVIIFAFRLVDQISKCCILRIHFY